MMYEGEYQVFELIGGGLVYLYGFNMRYFAPAWRKLPYKIRLKLKCHCLQDGHALNSQRCPRHGYIIVKGAPRNFAV